MNHQEAVRAATKLPWRYGANAENVLRAYLEARADDIAADVKIMDDDERWVTHRGISDVDRVYPDSAAAALLVDFGEVT